MRVRARNGRQLEIVAPEMVPMPEGQKSVLQGVAAFASRQVADPSYAQLARYCGVTARTAQRGVAGLEARGLLQVKERRSPSGYQLSHEYQITSTGVQTLKSLMRRGDLIDAATGALIRERHRAEHSEQKLTEPKGVTECHPPNEYDVVNVVPLQITARLSGEDRAAAISMLAHLPIKVGQQLADELRERVVTGQVRSPLGYLARLIQAYGEGRYRPTLAARGAKARAPDRSEEP